MIYFPRNSFPFWLTVVVLSLTHIACSGRRPPESPNGVAEVEPKAEPQAPEAMPADSIPARPAMAPGYRIVYDQASMSKEPVSNFDVLHTVLDLRLDLPNERVVGTAVHRLTPLVDALDLLQFDARDMEIQAVMLRRPEGDFQNIPYQYDNVDLRIPLQPQAGRTVALEVRIDYIAHPTRNRRKLGMVFVDGDETDPTRPTQVWTLGQPEDNEYWFPSWDYPNDRMTFDMAITVPANFSTIANGDLVEQSNQPDGFRRDRWVLNKPHASYLAGFAVGEYAAAVENYVRRDGSAVPLAYLVEPQYADNTKLIFGETPQIMRFMEDKLGVAYPWSNYKQVAVRDFTASGMENTTATLLYDDIQHDSRAHLDFTGRDLIAHELAHQWFGNLVTCRNWANLPLNEGFASYFERLYLEETRGLADAQEHTIGDRNLYFDEAQTVRRPIVWHGYSDPNEMFDRHSYQKAAMVLHQLRFELGDDVWWQGVRRYIRDNAFGSVVVEDLQRAMEQASGRSLSGFFNQWFRRPGHPEIEVTHRYFPSRALYEIQVRQKQDSLRIGNFSFEVDIEINVVDAEPWVQRYRIASTDTTFRIGIPGNISFVRFDAGDWALAEIQVTKNLNEWLNQLRYEDEPAGRYDAVSALKSLEPSDNIRNALLRTLRDDPAAFVRKAAGEGLELYASQKPVRDQFLSSLQNDDNSGVRRAVLKSLGRVQDDQLLQGLHWAIQDASYFVVVDAVRLLAASYPAQAVRELRPLFNMKSWNNIVEKAVIETYGQLASLEGIPYLQELLGAQTDEEMQIASVMSLSRIAQSHPEVQRSVAGTIIGVLSSPLEPVRFTAVKALEPIRDAEIVAQLQRRMQSETSSRVRQAITSLVGPQNE